MYPENRNTVLGAGYVFFDELTAPATYRGGLYLANTERFEISVTPGGRVTDYDADGEIATLNLDIDTQVERTASFITKHISDLALKLFFGAPNATSNGAAAAHTDDPINGSKACTNGYWYQLGETPYAVGARFVSLVTVRTVETTPVVLTEGEDEDYILDAANGRIYLVPGGAGTGKILEADFTVSGSAGSVLKVASPTHRRIRGKLTFVSANTVGRDRTFLFPDVILSPNGPFALKSREEVQRLSFNARIQQPETGSAIIIAYGGSAG